MHLANATGLSSSRQVPPETVLASEGDFSEESGGAAKWALPLHSTPVRNRACGLSIASRTTCPIGLLSLDI